MQAKLNKLPLKQAQDTAELYCELIRREVDRLTVEKESGDFRKAYQLKANEIINKNIKKKILEGE